MIMGAACGFAGAYLTFLPARLHGGVFHILFNMLALWMFGGELERMLRSQIDAARGRGDADRLL